MPHSAGWALFPNAGQVSDNSSNLHARLIAAFIDSNVIASCILLGFFAYDYLFAPNKLWLFILTAGIVFAYEPLAVTLRGQTLGHWYKNRRVIHAVTGDRIGIRRALARFFLKYLIWPLSLSWMLFSHEHHSIHDIITRTRSIPANELRPAVQEQHVAGVRQIIVTMIWLCGLLLLFNFVFDWLLPQCLHRGAPGYCDLAVWIGDVGNVMIWVLVFWYGTDGKLLGARS